MDEVGGYTKDVVRIEYEWKPPRCSLCKVFGHTDTTCPMSISKTIPNNCKDVDGFEEAKKKKGQGQVNNGKTKSGFPVRKEQQFIYRPVANKNVTNEPKTFNIFNGLNAIDDEGKPIMEQPVKEDIRAKKSEDEIPTSNATATTSAVDLKTGEESDVEAEKGPMAKFMAEKTEGASTFGKNGLRVQSCSLEYTRYEQPPKAE